MLQMLVLGYVEDDNDKSHPDPYTSFIGGNSIPFTRVDKAYLPISGETKMSTEDDVLSCPNCHARMVFICQLYCPLDFQSFHRQLIFYACAENDQCWHTANSSSENENNEMNNQMDSKSKKSKICDMITPGSLIESTVNCENHDERSGQFQQHVLYSEEPADEKIFKEKSSHKFLVEKTTDTINQK